MVNIFEGFPAQLPEELITILAMGKDLRIERIVSKGHHSPDQFWYDQEESEWVMVLRGHARLELETGIKEMRPGDCLLLPAHCRHRVAWTTPDEQTIWLAVFFRSGV